MKVIELTDEERAALTRAGRINGQVGQQRLRENFLADVDRATPGLPAEERQRRAEVLYRQHMAGLANHRHSQKATA